MPLTFLFSSFDTSPRADSAYTTSGTAQRLRRPRFQYNQKLLVILGIVFLMVISFFVGRNSGSGTTSVLSSVDERTAAPKAKARQIVNKELLIPLKDEKEKELGEIRYFIESAELYDEILVKGQRARAIAGRTFLIMNLKITNPLKQGSKINTKDYIRLSVNGKSEMLAPDIHNDPVQVQAISTKSTRVGFPVNDSDKNLTVYLGEIGGSKQTVHIKF